MVKDDHTQEGPGQPESGGAEWRLSAVLLLATVLITMLAILGVHWIRSGGAVSQASEKDSDGTPGAKLHLFRGWEKPELVLVLSGQQHGYLQPCGCSSPQRGGLLRRYNLLFHLKQRGWPVVPLDLGEVAQSSAPRGLPNVEGLIKYRYAMEALRIMGYLAVGIGESDGSLPLKAALDNFALNNPEPPVLCANLKDKERDFPDEVRDSVVVAVPGSGIKVAVIAMVGATVAEAMSKDGQVKFSKVRDTLEKAIAKVDADKPDLRVLLYQGTPDEARKLIKAFPKFAVVMCQSEDDEGPSQPEVVGSTCLVKGVGHKGKNIGVLGVFRTGAAGQPFTFRFQHVQLGEEWQPAGGFEQHPMARLMERYTEELKSGGYLKMYGQGNHPLQVTPGVTPPHYVGSDKCKSCHEAAYEVWKHSDHSHAYHTLERALHPSRRQFDGECVVCHVTGFAYKTGFKDAESTPKLKDVGCENCHGPGSSHYNAPSDPKWYPLLNPWKAKPNETEAEKARRVLAIDKDCCQKCHDSENDVHWSFEEKWPKVVHHTPPGG
jgi:hypothetical protein